MQNFALLCKHFKTGLVFDFRINFLRTWHESNFSIWHYKHLLFILANRNEVLICAEDYGSEKIVTYLNDSEKLPVFVDSLDSSRKTARAVRKLSHYLHVQEHTNNKNM